MKKKYLLITAIAVMTLCLGACGKQTATEQPAATENTTVDEIKEEITSTTEEPKKNEKTELIIDNSNSKYTDENAETEDTPNKKEGENAEDISANDASESDADSVDDANSFACTDDVSVTVPENYNVEEDGANIMMTKDNIRICINMTETSIDKDNRLQEKLSETIANPEAPFEAGNSGRYNDCVYKNETYTVLTHYFSDKTNSNIYVIKMTADRSEDTGETYDDYLPYCYYFVASDVTTDGSMMVARTSDIQEDSTATELAKNIFK